jgi:hypothetical protein
MRSQRDNLYTYDLEESHTNSQETGADDLSEIIRKEKYFISLLECRFATP